MIIALASAVLSLAPRLNVVMIFSDDHARRAISAYGSPLIQTPGIDRLAREGARFDRHYTTNPICAPSRASLLTGKYSHINGHRDNATTFDGGQMTFPKLLQQAGYETAVIGKWHLVSNPTGFDHWEVLPGQGAYYDPDFLTSQGTHRESGYVTEVITKKSLQWLGERKGKPFFLLMGHKAPHRNWAPGPAELNLFTELNFPEPATLRTDYATLASGAAKVQMRIDRDLRPAQDLFVGSKPARLSSSQDGAWTAAYARDDAKYRQRLAQTGDLLGTNYQRYLQSYLRCVAAVDHSVEQVMSYLEQTGLSKNTVVIYASDQGFFLGENGWYDKRWFYEPSAGTPLIIRLPNGQGARPAVDRLTANVDLAPTILDFARVAIPKEIQGQSLVTLLKGGDDAAARPSVYGHFYESEDGDHKAPKYVSLVTKKHKVIFYYELDEWELFDVLTDPDERLNLWSSPASRGIRSEMVRKLAARQRELGEDPGLIRLGADSSAYVIGAQTP